MKKTLSTLLSVLFCAITFAQSVPQGINYQAVARDASGAVLMNQTLTIQFSVISDITTSAVSWQETHTVNTNDYGLYTAIIGGGTATNVGSSATFDVINWGASNHLLKVEVDFGSGYLDMGTTAFMSVPYSIYSANPGPQGLQGVAGVDGDDGQDGQDGPPGQDGSVGATGSQGIQGVPGNDGQDGQDGAQGIAGDDGIDGLNGAVGATGPAGADGLNGTNGVNGNDGIDGVDGVDGQGGITNAGTGISVTGAGTSVSPYVVSTVGCTYSVGDLVPALGGYIFYLDGSGCHGLVAKATDEGYYQWSSTNFTTWSYASGIYGGAQNTKKSIARAVANSSTCPAASVCDNLASGGYTDWYLPSKDELDMMYVNLHLQGLGGFANNYYWSSTENDFTNAWVQNFFNGNQDYLSKHVSNFVRAVRAF
jgi:hypothetical protein